MGFIDDWKEWSTLKKVASIVVVCCVGLIIVGVLLGGSTSDVNTSTTSSSSSNDTAQASGVQVKVIYEGEWQGAISSGDTSNTISGSGEDTIDVEDSSFIVSANAQKMDGGDGNLTIQILKDGNVVKEASTSSEYGVASVSSSV